MPKMAKQSMNIKAIARRWLPPALISHLKPLLKRGIYYSGNYPDWASAEGHSSGYDAALILERVKQARVEVMAGRAVYERDSVIFDEVKHSFPVLAGLLRAAIESSNQLSVLDFGGSLGSTYFQCRDFLSMLPLLKWGVVEQEHFVNCGRGLLETDELRFFFTIADCVRQNAPNVALLSSVLQYLPQPYNVVDELMDSCVPYIVIDRTPFGDYNADWITIQHVPPSIYEASYPCWVFDKKKFLERFVGRYQVIALFNGSDDPGVANGLGITFGGMILCKV
jgi:putative methyltransferase (TIGR04325 family)